MSISSERWLEISKILQSNGISLEEINQFLVLFNEFTDDEGDFEISPVTTDQLQKSNPIVETPDSSVVLDFNGSVPPE